MTITQPSPTRVEPTPRAPLDERAAQASPHRPRRWPRRVLIGVNLFLGLCLVATMSLYGYVRWRFGQIHRITIAGLSIGPAPGGTGAGDSGSAGPAMNILVVGSDTRAGLANGAQFGGSAVGGARSDTIMIVHLDPSARSASLLSIPRDLWVPIAGMGTQRINAAFNTGPDLLVRTIQDDLGIPINHYVDVDFDSFRQVVNAVGGVKFWYPEPVRDNDNGVNDSGLDVTAPGCYTLNGNMALSLVRTRHMQYEDNGRWIFEAQSDLARIRRQQLFIKKIVTRAEALGLTDITKINGVVGGVVSNLTVDSGFTQSEMLQLARRYRSFNPSTLPTATLPTTAAVIGGADVLLLQKGPAQTVIDLWEGIAPPPSTADTGGSAPTTGSGLTTGSAPTTGAATAGAVTVRVRNGSGVSHQASTAVAALRAAGYSASVGGDAAGFGYQSSAIGYGPSDAVAAQQLQARITGGAQLQPDSSLPSGTLVLTTGATFGGVGAPSAPSTAAPGATPTAPAPTSSTATALAAVPGNTSAAPAFPGPQGQDPPPPGSGC